MMIPKSLLPLAIIWLGFINHAALGFVISPRSVPKSTPCLRASLDESSGKETPKRRKILFITTDMMRWNSLGYYGDPYAQTPNLDRLAADGIRYDAASSLS
jgi:hypothetical protein